MILEENTLEWNELSVVCFFGGQETYVGMFVCTSVGRGAEANFTSFLHVKTQDCSFNVGFWGLRSA